MSKADRQRESEDEDRPWSEAQWAAFMREGEARAARMGEILETVIDQPDRWEIVAREMGWELQEEDEDGEPDADDQEELDGEEAEFVVEEDGDEADDDEPFDMDAQDREIEAIPAYAKAMALSDKIDDLLKPFLKGQGTVEEEVGELVSDAYIQIKIIGAKISGGHAMGYEDEVLCGNIVCNTIAREAAEKCGEALVELNQRKVFNGSDLEPLLTELDGVKKALDDRIADLRSRVWW